MARPGAVGRRRVTSNAGLDARLLIRADDVVPATQRLAIPGASVEVQDTPSFFGEFRVAWKDPVLIPPGLDRVRVEDSPDGAGTDRSAQVPRGSVGQVSGRQPTQRQLGLADGLTGDRLDDRPVARGKRRACARGPLDQPMRSCHMPSDGASGGRNWSAVPPDAPAATFDRSGDSWSKRANRALWRSACGTVRLRTRLRHLSRNSSGNTGRSKGAGPGMVRLHSQEAIGYPAERVENRPYDLPSQPQR